ncbi:methyltransferase domain-containing protein [Mycolicibacterium fluoranthenivorans]|uniref:Methyltransferase domain-containing protein n=1 Tax=Mycolicibacterium fluoranthenivorans TaxID=258505 RepID=A0A7G8PGN9_9MYCO|nr:class I SAM-dependent methyltransferase [Mycolicibacterium fluoranthenivorans]QNJ93505.1 methyltransferase domain-containing protein [Mycolicibacterium fluoranthenivorans]
MTERVNAAQVQAWNGDSGRAWVTLQPVLDQTLKPFEDLIVDSVAAAAEPRAQILDLGCGTGATTLALAERVGGLCTGIDISEPMIELARTRARDRRLPVDFIIGDAQAFPFPAHTFDVLVSRFGVMFFDDPQAAFGNLRRATRPGGRLTFVCWRHPEDNPFMATAERAAAHLLPDLKPVIAGSPGPVAFADPDRTRSVLSAGGWSAIDIRPVDVTCTMPESDLLPYLTQMGSVGRALRTVDSRTRAQVIAALREAYSEFVVDGEVRYPAACWMVEARG